MNAGIVAYERILVDGSVRSSGEPRRHAHVASCEVRDGPVLWYRSDYIIIPPISL